MPYRNYDVTVYENLREVYRDAAARYGSKTLFYEKKTDFYTRYSYLNYCNDVDALATALADLGLTDKKILLMGENCYAWTLSYMA